MSLPTTAKDRKSIPLATGCLDYFPDALAAVADVSRVGNEQHHPGTSLHWDRSKSTDEADALMRHFVERGSIDTDGVRHSAKVAWRALALLQKEIEADMDGAVEADRDWTEWTGRKWTGPITTAVCDEIGCRALATGLYEIGDGIGNLQERWLCSGHRPIG